MKKLFLFTLLFALTHLIYADDIIYLNNGKEINAKILKVSTNLVEYKKSNNLEGPTYELIKDKILMIVYENGEKDIFKKEEIGSPKNTLKNPGIYGTVEYDGEKLLAYNGDSITTERYIELAKQNCLQAYSLYNNGQKLKTAGTICMCVGAPLTTAGLVFLIFSQDYRANMIGGAIALVGMPTLATGIPLFCVGKYKKSKSYEVFNRKSQGYTTSQLQLNLNNDGIGLALVF